MLFGPENIPGCSTFSVIFLPPNVLCCCELVFCVWSKRLQLYISFTVAIIVVTVSVLVGVTVFLGANSFFFQKKASGCEQGEKSCADPDFYLDLKIILRTRSLHRDWESSSVFMWPCASVFEELGACF
jgi:low affinity Fe/Cu permease